MTQLCGMLVYPHIEVKVIGLISRLCEENKDSATAVMAYRY